MMEDLQHALLSVDYYPEHWSESRWSEDARLMRRAGIGAVRIAEFAWCRMELREGRFAEAHILFPERGEDYDYLAHVMASPGDSGRDVQQDV